MVYEAGLLFYGIQNLKSTLKLINESDQKVDTYANGLEQIGWGLDAVH